jgi:hypothetical protein
LAGSLMPIGSPSGGPSPISNNKMLSMTGAIP